MIDFNRFSVVTFDCYGTLIDWETGILSALHPMFERHRISMSDQEILERYAEYETGAEAGEYISYRMVLRTVLRRFANQFHVTPTEHDVHCLEQSIQHWQPFDDTVEALQALQTKYRLAVISNIDNDLFSITAKHLKVTFDTVITAQQMNSYKPSQNNFQEAIKRLSVSPNRILHVAQSLYHDVAPAKVCGITTVWVNRRSGKQGFGATPPSSVTPDIEVTDLRALVSLAV